MMTTDYVYNILYYVSIDIHMYIHTCLLIMTCTYKQ